MAADWSRRLEREPRGKGPSGLMVFVVFLLLAALCLAAGFAIGHYFLSSLEETVAGGQPGAGEDTSGGGTSPPGDTGSGTGGTGSGGTGTPAGGGPGSVNCNVTPLAVYSVQVGAFASRANAESVVENLAGKGYPGFVADPTGGTNLYRVRAATLTNRDAAVTVAGRLKTQGYADCFVQAESLDSSPLTLSGSSLDYLRKAAVAVETLAACIRTEGDVWDDYYNGTLNRTEALAAVRALATRVTEAANGLGALVPPADLAALGNALDQSLDAALENLTVLGRWLEGQAEADRLEAASSFMSLVHAYVKLGSGLRSTG